MKFYSNFRYQNTEFFNTLQKAVDFAIKPKGSVQLTLIYSVRKYRHVPVRVIVNGRVYGKKHALSLGYPNLGAFGNDKFRKDNK